MIRNKNSMELEKKWTWYGNKHGTNMNFRLELPW
jgi:hypothetical protein